jgi:hypothetical protein
MKRTLTVIAATALTASAALTSLLPASPAGAATTAAKRTAVTSGRVCDEGHWPASTQGQPLSFHPGGPAGYYVWHDASGWHLRTTTPTTEGHTFTGRITASDDIKILRVFKNEKADNVKLAGRSITFRFDTHNHVDGIDFKVGCAETLRFALSAEGRAWPSSRIKLGATGDAPSNPFTVTRRSSPAA